jgi:xanthine/uracil/vitamin C permease (AzgA family)
LVWNLKNRYADLFSSPCCGVQLAFLVYSEVLGKGVQLPAALACCFSAAVVIAALTLFRALSLVLALVPNTVCGSS